MCCTCLLQRFRSNTLEISSWRRCQAAYNAKDVYLFFRFNYFFLIGAVLGSTPFVFQPRPRAVERLLEVSQKLFEKITPVKLQPFKFEISIRNIWKLANKTSTENEAIHVRVTGLSVRGHVTVHSLSSLPRSHWRQESLCMFASYPNPLSVF